MMQVTQSIASTAALALVLRLGATAFRRDMVRLMVAAMLGLAYLGYMDFLIVWYGNLPAHVGFYLARMGGVMALLIWAELLLGLAAPILLLWLSGEDRGQRPAGVCALAAILLFNGWWVSGGMPAMLGGLLLGALALGAMVLVLAPLREAPHG